MPVKMYWEFKDEPTAASSPMVLSTIYSRLQIMISQSPSVVKPVILGFICREGLDPPRDCHRAPLRSELPVALNERSGRRWCDEPELGRATPLEPAPHEPIP